MSITVLSVGYPLAPVAENTAGGAEQILGILDEALVDAGHRSIVIAPEGSHCRGLLLPTKLPEEQLDDNARQCAHREYTSALESALAEHEVDVVHMHGIDFLEYLPEAGVPVIVTLHLPLSWYPAATFSLSRPNTHLVCVSESQKARGMPTAEKCHVIANGVRLDRYRPAGEKTDYAVCLGRVCPEKGFHLALDAASEAGVPLILAGQVFGYKAHQEYFETMIRPRLRGGHRFIGAVGGKHKNQLLAGARCLVVPSLVAETSCLVAMEALACGTPVVAFRRGALAEVVEHGCTGLLVETPSQLSKAMVDARELSSSLCRERAERNFSAAKMIDAYFSLYQELAVAGERPEVHWEKAA